MQLLDLVALRKRLSPSSISASTALHAAVIAAILGVFAHAPHIAPYKLPGTTQGTALLTYYSPGSPAHTTSTLPEKKPIEQAPTSTSRPALQAPASPKAAAPAADLGTGSSTQSGLGEGNIKIALQKFFPYPRPDISTLPHGASGDVILNAVIDQNGKITDLTLLKGLGPNIDNAVIAVVKQWSYSPATKDGIPVSSEQELHFHYERS